MTLQLEAASTVAVRLISYLIRRLEIESRADAGGLPAAVIRHHHDNARHSQATVRPRGASAKSGEASRMCSRILGYSRMRHSVQF